jgi:hypothetical protein
MTTISEVNLRLRNNKKTRPSVAILKNLRLERKKDFEKYSIKQKWHRDEFIKCYNSPFYFINNWVSIKTKNGLDLFELYPYQTASLLYFMTHDYNIVLKSRQMGYSMLLCAYMLWYAMFRGNQNILSISIKHSVARRMLTKIKDMYKYLPEFLQVEILNGTGGSYGTADEMIFANGSRIAVSSSSPDTARSETLNLLVSDELAFQEHARQIWHSAQPTLGTSGGKVIFNSTPFGVGNLFHETWVHAKDKGFKRHLAHWSLHPDKDKKWYAKEAKKLGVKGTAQELDCSFLSSGYNVFNLVKIREFEDDINSISPLEYIGTNEINEPTGYIYEDVEQGYSYVIGADVSSGRARDYSTFSIMREDGKEVACYKGKVTISEFTDLLYSYGTRYNNALLAPEVNNVGNGVVQLLLAMSYPNIYVMRADTKVEHSFNQNDEANVYGWQTTTSSRERILTGLNSDIEHDRIIVRNPFFVQEATTFIYNENNKAIALGKQGSVKSDSTANHEDSMFHDDAIFSVAIANEVRKSIRYTYSRIITY